MRISHAPQVCYGLLCSLLILGTGCSNPSSQSLDSLSISATPSAVTVGGAVALHATAHLSDGTTQDVTASTLWTLSNPALATVANGMLTGKHHFATPTLMEELLKKDGVTVKDDTVVDFKKRFWDPSKELTL